VSGKHRIEIWGALRPFADGAPFVLVEAQTIGELFSELSQKYPGMAPQIERGVAVSIDGVIHRDQWDAKLPQGAEIYVMPRLAGG